MVLGKEVLGLIPAAGPSRIGVDLVVTEAVRDLFWQAAFLPKAKEEHVFECLPSIITGVLQPSVHHNCHNCSICSPFTDTPHTLLEKSLTMHTFTYTLIHMELDAVSMDAVGLEEGADLVNIICGLRCAVVHDVDSNINTKCWLWFFLVEAQLRLCGFVTNGVDALITKCWLWLFLVEAQLRLCGFVTNSSGEDTSTKKCWLWLFLAEAQLWLCGFVTNGTCVQGHAPISHISPISPKDVTYINFPTLKM